MDMDHAVTRFKRWKWPLVISAILAALMFFVRWGNLVSLLSIRELVFGIRFGFREPSLLIYVFLRLFLWSLLLACVTALLTLHKPRPWIRLTLLFSILGLLGILLSFLVTFRESAYVRVRFLEVFDLSFWLCLLADLVLIIISAVLFNTPLFPTSKSVRHSQAEATAVVSRNGPGFFSLMFSSRGRIGLGRFWGMTIGLTFFFAIFATMLVVSLFSLDDVDDPLTVLVPMYILLALAGLVVIWSQTALTIKRWHDRDKSGWWIFIGLVPLVGPVWAFIENYLLPGTDGPNRFGPKP